MRYFPFLLLLFTVVGFAADEASDKPSPQYGLERQYNVALKTQNDGDYDKALEEWNAFFELLKKSPQSNLVIEATFNRGLCSYKLQKFEDAKRDLDEVLKSKEKSYKKDVALLFSGLSAKGMAEKNPEMALTAQKFLERFLEKYPNSKEVILAKFNLANVYEQINELEKAKELYSQIWQSPQNEFAPDAYLHTGYILFNQKLYEKCAQHSKGFLEKWKDEKPGVFYAEVLTGDALYLSGDFDQAERHYAFAANSQAEKIKFEKLDYAMYNRGACLLMLSKNEDAAIQFSDVINRFPKSAYVPAATLACGEAYWKNKNVQKAKEYLLKAAEFNEYSPKANTLLAEAYLRENDIDNAVKRIDMIPELQFKWFPNAPEAKQAAVRQVWALRVQILSMTDDPERLQTCIEQCDNISRMWPDNPCAPWATLLAAHIEFKLGHYDKAIVLCRRIRSEWKNSLQFLDSQILEANCLVKNKEYEEAGNMYFNLYKNNANNARRFDWLVFACKMYDVVHDYKSIYENLSQEISNIKSDALLPDAMYLYGKAACELAHYDKSLEYLKQCQEKYPNYPGMDKVLYVKGSVYVKLNDNENAIETFQKLLKDYPDTSVKQGATSYLTALYQVKGDFTAALEQADKNIEQNVASPYRPGAILDSIRIHIKKSEWNQGLERSNLFIKDYPQNDSAAEVYYLRSLCKYNIKRYEETTADCRQGLEIAKQKKQLDKWELLLRQLEVSSLAQQENKIDETKKAFDAFMETKQRLNKSIANEDSVVFLYANALYNADQKLDACRQYKYLYDNYKKSPFLFESAFALGQEAANLKRNDKAKVFLSFAVDGKDPEAAVKSAHKLGWLSYDEKSYEDALKWFNRAIEIYDASKDSLKSDVADIVLDSRIMTADSLYWQKKFAEALTQYKKLPELPVQYRVMTTVRFAQCAIETGDFDLASSLIDKVLDANNALISELAQTSQKWEPALQHLRAKIWFNTNKKDQAEKLFGQIVKENVNADPATIPETSFLAIAESWFYLGELSFQKSAFRDAIPLYYNVIYGYKFPDLQADACYEAGRCFEALKQTAQARKMYQTILDEYPSSPKARFARSKLRQLQN